MQMQMQMQDEKMHKNPSMHGRYCFWQAGAFSPRFCLSA
jgi:hypothetical protein